jgi:hypothetical protein
MVKGLRTRVGVPIMAKSRRAALFPDRGRRIFLTRIPQHRHVILAAPALLSNIVVSVSLTELIGVREVRTA